MTCRTGLPAGVVLLASGMALLPAVIAWRLLGASFSGDVATICDAEAQSGFTLRRDMPALGAWVRAHLATSEGQRFYAELRDAPVGERGARLRVARAGAAAVPEGAPVAPDARCAIASSYDALNADGIYRADVQHLCSRIDLPQLDELDEALRLQALEEWLALHAESPRSPRLGLSLREAPGGPERAGVLAAAARSVDILSCENARALEHPPVQALTPGSASAPQSAIAGR